MARMCTNPAGFLNLWVCKFKNHTKNATQLWSPKNVISYENPPDGGVYVVVLQNPLDKPHCINE